MRKINDKSFCYIYNGVQVIYKKAQVNRGDL